MASSNTFTNTTRNAESKQKVLRLGDVRVKWFFWMGEKGDFLIGVSPY